jgi:hypothetical protein
MTALLPEIEHSLSRLTELRMPWGQSRFGRYAEVLREVQTPRPSTDAKNLAFEAASQLMQLAFSVPCWSTADEPILRRTLKDILAGPLVAIGDDDKPRNTLLEVLTASLLMQHGFDVRLTINAEDAALHHPKLGQGAVECKRPAKLKNVFKSLKKIGKQLRSRRAAGARFGIAVMGADRLVMSPSEQFIAATVEEVDDVTGEMSKDLARFVLQEAMIDGCDVAPAAEIAVVVLSGTVAVRQPRVLRPFCVWSPLPLVSPSTMPKELDDVFAGPPAGALQPHLARRATLFVEGVGVPKRSNRE